MQFTINRLFGSLLLTAAFCAICYGQTAKQVHFGQAPDSLFNEDRYPANPDVPFIYSLKKLDITFEQSQESIIAVMDYRVRVKIFDSSIPQASIVGIPYYFKNNTEQITSIGGITYHSPTESVKLSEKNIRTINLNSRFNLKEFTMPAVEDGSVIEYTYQIRRRYIEELPAFYLSNQVPTKLAKITITYPKYLRYNAVIERFNHTLQHNLVKINIGDVPKIFTYPQPEPIIKEIWTARNIPAVQQEKFISSLDDYRGKIKFQLSEFGLPRQPLENSWDFVVEEIRQKQKIWETIRENEQAWLLGESIRASAATKKAAQDSIFKYLNKQIKFTGSRSPFNSAAGSAVLSGEPSGQAAINQTLTAMLRGAGIEASPILISTRTAGKINTEFPSFFQFNGQLTYSKIDGQSYFMDASFPHSQPNLIPVETYNQTGLLLEQNSYRWVDIKPAKSVFSIQINIDAQLNRDGSLSGTIRADQLGYPAQQIRQNKADGMPVSEIIRNSVFDGYSELELSDIELSQLKDYERSVQFSASFTLAGYAVSFTDGLQFRPMALGYLLDNPFSETQRKLPVTLDAPEKLDMVYNITLPENYTLEQNPQNRIIQLPGAVFEEQYEVSGQTLHYEFHIDILQKQFNSALYPRLVNLYERWVQLSNARWFVE